MDTTVSGMVEIGICWNLANSSGFQVAGMSRKLGGVIDVKRDATLIESSRSEVESSEVAILGGGSGYADGGYGRSPKGLSLVFVIERSGEIVQMCRNLYLKPPRGGLQL